MAPDGQLRPFVVNPTVAPWEFDAFARFCDPGDAMLKQWSQYEFIQYVKQRYQVLRMMPRDLPAGDMEYHLDED